MDQAVEHEGGLDLTSPSIYADWHEDRIRFRDLDPLGHVTSLAFLTYFETARVLFLARCGAPVEAREMGWMLVRVEADFVSQLHFPGEVRIGTRALRLGKASLTTGQGLFSGQRCVGSLTSTLVHVDRTSNRSVAIPAPVRERITALSAEARPARGG